MAIADELIALLGFELTGEDAAKRYEGTLKRLERTAERVGAAIGTAIKVGAAAGAAALTLLTRSVISTSAEFEKYQATLETIEGSAEKARESLDWIAEFAKTTPYDVAQVTEAFIKLKAYGIDPIADDTLRTLGDTASAMGKDLNQAVEALADAQTGEFERLKEFGIRAKQQGDEVTFSWTKNGEELTETVKKNATEIRAFLLETMGDRFTGAMDRQSRTWNGMVSNLGDTWTGFQRRIGEAGFFEKISQRLSSLLDTIERLDSEGRLDEWATAISNTLTWFADIFWAVGTRIAEVSGFIIDNFDTLKPIVIGLGIALGALLVWAFPVISAFIAIGLAVDDLIAYLQGGESVIGSFIEWCKQLPETLMEAAGAFGTWLSNIDWGKLGNDAGRLLIDALALAIITYWTTVTDISRAVLDAFTNIDWGAVLNAIIAGFQAYIDLFYGFWEGVGTRIAELVKEWFNIDLVAIGAKMAQDILTGLQTLGAAIQEWFNSLFQEPQWLKDAKAFLGMGPDTGPGAVAAEVQSGGQPTPDPDFQTPTLDDEAWDYKMELQRQEWETMLNNAGENIAKLAPDTAVDATITDARTDARAFPLTNNVTVNQTVTQATNAPTAAANATGQAVQGAVANQRSQIETEPSF
jgi:hypothetical protein